jgi:uncharacterized protein YbjT (DUF2867 family)
MLRVAIVGAGRVAQALCRDLATEGHRVTILAPSPAPVPALWRKCDAVSGDGLRAGLEGAEVVVFAAWSANTNRVKDVAEIGGLQTARAAKEADAERFILLGPTGASADATSAGGRAHHAARQQVADRAPPSVCLGLPVVFGQGDALTSPWLSALSAGRAPRIAGPNAWVQPLWIQDATRAVRRVMMGEHDGEFLELLGPERWRVSALAQEVCTRDGTKPSRLPRRLSPEVEALLRDQQTAGDDWERLHLGQRRTLNQWLSNQGGE